MVFSTIQIVQQLVWNYNLGIYELLLQLNRKNIVLWPGRNIKLSTDRQYGRQQGAGSKCPLIFENEAATL